MRLLLAGLRGGPGWPVMTNHPLSTGSRQKLHIECQHLCSNAQLYSSQVPSMSASNEYSDQNSTVTPDDTSDNDSALGSDASSLTESLRSSLFESVRENGRGYHRYKSALGGQYPLPEDEGEQDRLDLQHEMFLRTFNQKLFLSPLREDVRHVLDIGTGTGIWVMKRFSYALAYVH